jgi:hypothetical protein
MMRKNPNASRRISATENVRNTFSLLSGMDAAGKNQGGNHHAY